MKKSFVLVFNFVFLLISQFLFSQNFPKNITNWGDATYWKDNAGSGNWNAYNWYDATQGWDNHNPNYEGGRNLIFDNNNQTSMTNDFDGSGVGRWQITFTSNATTSRAINGSTENIFYDNSATNPKIENQSSANHTINFPFKISYNPMELNPVNGDLTISSAIDNNGNYIDVYGTNSKVLTLTGNIQGTGGLVLKQNSRVILSTNNKSYTGNTILEEGILELSVNLSSSITVENTATLIINGSVTIPELTVEVGGIVTISTGNSLTVSGALTNSAGSTGLVIESGGSLITNSTVSGSATVKREIASDNKWHFISSPVSGQNICDGNFAPLTANFNSTTGATFDFFKWNASGAVGAANWINLKKADWSANTDDFGSPPAFDVKTGYLVAYSSSFAGSTTKSFTGTPNTGDQTVTLTTSGNTWNLVGNPFPSAIDWDAVTGKANLTDGYYSIYNEAKSGGAGFESYLDATHKTAGTNGKISSIQGFFVAASASPIGIPNTARVIDNNWLKSDEAGTVNQLVIKLSHDVYYDESFIIFESTGSLSKGWYDAGKLLSLDTGIPQVYTMKDNDLKICINSMPLLNGPVTVPIGMYVPSDGDYSIQLSGFESFASLPGILLEDLKTNTTRNIVQNPVYDFSAATGDDPNRFLLHLAGSIGISEKPVDHPFHIFASDHTLIVVDNTGKNQGELFVYNMMGQVIGASALNGNTMCKLNLDVPSGYYLVKITSMDQAYSGKVFISK